MSRRKWWLAAAVIGFAMLLFLAVELRSEGGRIGACVRDATALSQVSALVRASIYGDTDQFLGKSPRPYEGEFRASLANAYTAARQSALRCRALLYAGAAARAREVYLAAEQERNFVAEPRGNWMSYMSEVTKARTQFEMSKSRFELERPAIVWGDDSTSLAKAAVSALVPLAEAKAEAEKRRKEETARAADARARDEAERRSAARDDARRAAELAELAKHPPSRPASNSDLDWTWSESPVKPMVVAPGRVVSGVTETLRFCNTSPWFISSLQLNWQGALWSPQNFKDVAPSECRSIDVYQERSSQPAPVFSGTFAVPPALRTEVRSEPAEPRTINEADARAYLAVLDRASSQVIDALNEWLRDARGSESALRIFANAQGSMRRVAVPTVFSEAHREFLAGIEAAKQGIQLRSNGRSGFGILRESVTHLQRAQASLMRFAAQRPDGDSLGAAVRRVAADNSVSDLEKKPP